MKNNQVVNHIKPRWRAAVAAALIALLAMTGCLSNLQGNQNAAGVAGATAVDLQCTQACAERGQCGAGADRTDRVLLSSQALPVVDGHDIAVEVGSRAVIQQTVTETVETIATGQRFAHQFYRVQVEGTAVQGWVAQWCTVPVN